MNDTDEAEQFATKVVDTMGEVEALLMAMRFVLLVGQRATPQTQEVAESARDAVEAIKRVGYATGVLTPTP